MATKITAPVQLQQHRCAGHRHYRKCCGGVNDDVPFCCRLVLLVLPLFVAIAADDDIAHTLYFANANWCLHRVEP